MDADGAAAAAAQAHVQQPQPQVQDQQLVSFDVIYLFGVNISPLDFFSFFLFLLFIVFLGTLSKACECKCYYSKCTCSC
jgi:hypothetical protein